LHDILLLKNGKLCWDLYICHAHEEEAQHTTAREADLPVIFPTTWQAKTLALGRTHGIRLPATVSPLLAGAHDLQRSV
jgi:hypothetical protein